jgi:gliding motility-associated-like protein
MNDGFYMEKDEAAPEGNRLELGPGLVLCPGKTVTIKAPDGFSAYQWSNGQSGQEITVGQPGGYACTAIDFCGLSFTDSVQVSDASSVPLVVESSKTICPGAEVRFEALPGFSEYRWSPAYRMVSNPGGAVMVANPLRDTSYVLQARHPNGCVLMDTVRVLIDKVPAVSLGPDQYICAGDSTLLELPAGLGNHRWDNGATAPVRWVHTSGRYAVTVYSDLGCPASDTLEVRYKDCGSGFFMPNAFTPNNDGLNDVIKPVIGAVPVRYRFAVYNRWGQEVFSTVDPMQAWDGRLKGIAQQAQVFGWVCTWQVDGGTLQKRAGSIVLIR